MQFKSKSNTKSNLNIIFSKNNYITVTFFFSLEYCLEYNLIYMFFFIDKPLIIIK